MKSSLTLSYSAAVFALAAFVCAVPIPSTAKHSAKKKVDGEQVFKQYCSSCHLGGGNRIEEKHAVAGSKQLSSLATFKAYLNSPPGHMPYYQSLVNDKRTLQALYDFCKKLPPPPINSASNSL